MKEIKGMNSDYTAKSKEGETLGDNHEPGQSLEDEDERDHDEDQEGGPQHPSMYLS